MDFEEIGEQAVGKSTKTFEVDSSVIDEFYEYGDIEVEDLPLYPNQPVILKSGSQSLLGITSQDAQYIKRINKVKHYGIQARNKEQSALQSVLDDPSIRCVVITGRAGTGKSVIISGYCLEAVLEKKSHKKIIFSKPLEIVGSSKFWGTMPGGSDEKIEPFLKSFETCFDGIPGASNSIEYLKVKKQLEYVPVELMRGMSIRNSIVYFDEAQSLDKHCLSTLGSRMDDRGMSKLIISGDLNQIDNNRLRGRNKPGMTKMLHSRAFLESPITAHIELIKNERGEISDLFYDIFDKEDE